jgi:hypothetical protein
MPKLPPILRPRLPANDFDLWSRLAAGQKEELKCIARHIPAAVEALKAEGTLPRRVRLRQCQYLNNIVEQDHRTVKKRVWLAKGYGSFQSAWRT